MKLPIIVSILFCAIGLYLVKHIAYLHKSGTLFETLKRAIKKALRLVFIGTAALGLVCFALFQLFLANENGLSLLTSETLNLLCLMQETSGETTAAQAILQLLGSATLFFVQISLLFSIVEIFVIKCLVCPQTAKSISIDHDPAHKCALEDKASKAGEKLFLRLAHLRI